MESSQNRREYTRLTKNYAVEIRKLELPLDGQTPVEISAVDVSAGGLRVECPQGLAVGDKVQVTLFIPSLNKFHPGFFKVFESDAGQSLTAIGEVVYVHANAGGSGCGIRFINVDESDWQALHGFIVKQLRQAA